MGKNKGYAFEHETEERFMALRSQKRSDTLRRRCHRQPGSGSMDAAKGDVVVVLDFLEALGGMLIECKDRKSARGDGKSVSIRKDELDKARDEARQKVALTGFAFKVKQPVGGNRQPVFKADLDDPLGLRWMAMPFTDFFVLLEYLRDLYDMTDCGGSIPLDKIEAAIESQSCVTEAMRGLEGSVLDAVQAAFREAKGEVNGR